MKTVRRVEYNWYTTLKGEYFDAVEIGCSGISNIEEHRAAGEGDKWFYDISNENGYGFKIFNPNKVYYSKDLK